MGGRKLRTRVSMVLSECKKGFLNSTMRHRSMRYLSRLPKISNICSNQEAIEPRASILVTEPSASPHHSSFVVQHFFGPFQQY